MQISGITFTNREVDIIACIVNARNTKKIASILFISPRTVEAHIQNIMLKMGVNSQGAVIDFIENSNEFKNIKEHYCNLLIQFAFERQLKIISQSIKKHKVTCRISGINSEQCNKDQLLIALIKHLRMAGVEALIKDNANEESNASSIKCLQVICRDNIQQVLGTGLKNENQATVFLVIDNASSNSNLNAEDLLPQNIRTQLVELSAKEQYFYSVFRILGKLLATIDSNELIKQFDQLRANMLSSKSETNFESLLDSNSQDLEVIPADQKPQEEVSKFSSLLFLQKTLNRRTLAAVILLSSIVGLISLFAVKILKPNLEAATTSPSSSSNARTNIQTRAPEAITTLNELLSLIKKKELSADNVTTEQRHKNYSLVKKMESIFNHANKEKLQEYFNNPQVPSDELVDYLYNLQALASYYNYNEHDGIKARNILIGAKNLAENYAISRGKIMFAFDKLSNQQVYAELAVIRDLPEIYTRIIYSLGRTYIYQGDAKEAEKYFELSRYLGERMQLFEGYLSIISGLGIIKKDQIEAEIKNGSYEKATEKLTECIKLYKELKNSVKEYKLDYKPGFTSHQLIIPQQNPYNQVECSIRIAQFYLKLILITDDITKKAHYLQEISHQFLGDKATAGTLTILNKLPNKKVAYVYNSLGNILLHLYEEPIDAKTFISKVAKELNLAETGNLEVIEQVFKLAESHSRNTDYTKADAYDGLVRVYQKLIFLRRLNAQEERELLVRISELQDKRDSINQVLNRNYN